MLREYKKCLTRRSGYKQVKCKVIEIGLWTTLAATDVA